MKKIILFIASIMMLSSCVRSTYEIKYVDTANPADTLSAKITMSERLAFKREDVYFNVTVENEGMPLSPIMVYSLRGHSFISMTGLIHRSLMPIDIVEYRYIEKNK